MRYKLVKARSLHMPALVSKGMYLTKCGATIATRDLVTYRTPEVTCTGCRHRPNWPDKATQSMFNKL